MRDRKVTPLEYFGWLVEQCGVKDTPRNRKDFFYWIRLANIELAAVPGAVLTLPIEPSKTPWPARVVKYDAANGMLTLRARRCPTSAELERGDYDLWVKTNSRYSIDQVIRVESIPEPANAEGGGA